MYLILLGMLWLISACINMDRLVLGKVVEGSSVGVLGLCL